MILFVTAEGCRVLWSERGFDVVPEERRADVERVLKAPVYGRIGERLPDGGIADLVDAKVEPGDIIHARLALLSLPGAEIVYEFDETEADEADVDQALRKLGVA